MSRLLVTKASAPFLGAVFGVLSLVGACSSAPEKTPPSGQGEAGHFYRGDESMWERVFSEADPFALPDGVPAGIVMPHHDLMILSISRYYQALSSRVEPPVVVVISPNHFESGIEPVLVPMNTSFSTPSGALVPDGELVRSLVARGVAKIDEKLWMNEHGIYAHTPFVSRFFPGARFIPLAIMPGSSPSSALALAEALDELLPAGSLVIGSVDFSHYQIRAVAAHHDEATRSAIQNFELDDLDHLEVDSPETLLAVMRFCELRGAKKAKLVARSSSYDFTGDPVGETTSHQYWAFVPGEPEPRRTLSLFVPGAMKSDPGLGLRRYWEWDRYDSATEPGVRALARVAGKEARFLMGFDAYLFDLPPGESSLYAHGARVFLKSLATGAADENGADPNADIAIISWRGPCADPADLLRRSIARGYELALWRGDEEAMLALVPEPGSDLELVDLGSFLHPGAPIAGTLALLTWNDGHWTLDRFDYKSGDGYPPSIHQFLE